MFWEQARFSCWWQHLPRLVAAIKILCWLCGNHWLCRNCWFRLCRNLRVGAAGPPKYSTPWLLWTPINFFRFNCDFKRGLKSLWTPFLAPTNASGFYIIYALHVVFVWERGFSSSQPFPSGYLNDFFCNEVTLDCHLVSPATRAVLTKL